MTNSFGSIYVTSQVVADTNLTVSLVTGSTVPILTTTDLYFSFSANFDLYPHDVLIL